MPRIRFRKRDREKHRYYLLPGMGKGNKKKHRMEVRVAIVVGLLIGAVIGLAIYFTN